MIIRIIMILMYTNSDNDNKAMAGSGARRRGDDPVADAWVPTT